MSDSPSPAPPLDELIAASGISVPNGHPYRHISLGLVAWNEEARLPALLTWLRPWFETMVVGVQHSDDTTLAIAQELADVVVEDYHHGFGDATFGPLVLPRIQTLWTLKVDADERPSIELLESLSSATWAAEQRGHDGVWIPFRSSVDGIEYEEQHSHLRLFHTSYGWPNKLHSRPPINDATLWHTGYIQHDRTLDELVRDYLRYYKVGYGNAGWDAHNLMMMRSACMGTAAQKGWPYVQSHPWWPQVEAIAFSEDEPWRQR